MCASSGSLSRGEKGGLKAEAKGLRPVELGGALQFEGVWENRLTE